MCMPPIAPSPTVLAGLYKAMPEPQVLPCWLKNLPSVQEDIGSIPGWGRSPGEGDGNPLTYSCLEKSMDRGLAGYSPWNCRVRHNLHLCLSHRIIPSLAAKCRPRVAEAQTLSTHPDWYHYDPGSHWILSCLQAFLQVPSEAFVLTESLPE